MLSPCLGHPASAHVRPGFFINAWRADCADRRAGRIASCDPPRCKHERSNEQSAAARGRSPRTCELAQIRARGLASSATSACSSCAARAACDRRVSPSGPPASRRRSPAATWSLLPHASCVVNEKPAVSASAFLPALGSRSTRKRPGQRRCPRVGATPTPVGARFGGGRTRTDEPPQTQPSCLRVIPECQIFVMWRIRSPWKSMT
jgi:hypothetical protein